MASVFRFRQAEEVILRIAEYIAADSLAGAASWLDKIERTCVILAQFPMLGEDVSHLQSGLRRFCQGKYLVFYEPRSDGISVVRVLHGSQKIEDLFA